MSVGNGDIMNNLRRFIKVHWEELVAFMASIILSVFSILVTSFLPGLIFRKPGMIILNAIIIFAIFKLFESITSNYWLSLGLVIYLMTIFYAINKLKIKYRNEPLIPSDLVMIKSTKKILSMVNTNIIIYFIIFTIVYLLVFIYLSKLFPVNIKTSAVKRIIWIILPLLFFASSTMWSGKANFVMKTTELFGNEKNFWDPVEGSAQNGLIIQFLNSVDVKVMDKPKGYSRERMIEIDKNSRKLSSKINSTRSNSIKNQVIIFNLSESFSNPNRVPGIKVKNNPIKNIDKIKNNCTSGVMISSGYGGGTANMEYMTLTGLTTCLFSSTLTSPYTQLTPHLKNNITFNQSFKYSIGIHPYSAEMYNRIENYKKFKFNSFRYLGNKNDPIKYRRKIQNNQYLSDETLYKNALDDITSHHKGIFINLISIQNHMPYDNLYTNTSRWDCHSKRGLVNQQELSNYVQGIHYTDKAIAKFIDRINLVKKPITIVFYGDHLPGIYKNKMSKDGLKLHETDYFIYSNTYAREHGAIDLQAQKSVVSPSNFIAMVLKQTNSKVTPYQAFLTEVYEKLPAFSTNSKDGSSRPQFVSEKGNIIKYSELSPSQKKIWQEYKLVQYDMTTGKHYLLHSEFTH
ncbi:MAG: sulfatase-like hydrolase/transferase [Lactobacillus sp.]|nr:sulfatase-like hydrolase/transferase [Lactobacillus sp.]